MTGQIPSHSSSSEPRQAPTPEEEFLKITQALDKISYALCQPVLETASVQEMIATLNQQNLVLQDQRENSPKRKLTKEALNLRLSRLLEHAVLLQTEINALQDKDKLLKQIGKVNVAPLPKGNAASPIAILPQEMLTNILSTWLARCDQARASQVCKNWQAIINDQSIKTELIPLSNKGLWSKEWDLVMKLHGRNPKWSELNQARLFALSVKASFITTRKQKLKNTSDYLDEVIKQRSPQYKK